MVPAPERANPNGAPVLLAPTISAALRPSLEEASNQCGRGRQSSGVGMLGIDLRFTDSRAGWLCVAAESEGPHEPGGP